MADIQTSLDQAVAAGSLLESSRENILALLQGTTSPVAEASIQELIAADEWQELNDRFYKTLAFGTGGLRGRTIGRVVTDAELGKGGPNERPEHPCVGTASMNFYNVSRAIRGMVIYLKRYLAEQGEARKPAFVIGHDTRHFSRDFAEFCAKICTDLGCDVHLFDGPRSTPQISYAIRALNADAGVVLTASHNPSHDNGFKAYFNQGAQLVGENAEGVINEVNAITSEAYEPVAEAGRGLLNVLGAEADRVYMDDAKGLLLRPDLLENSDDKTKVVFTNLHGTGGHCIVPLLTELGFDVLTVPEQDIQDGRFPTVKSPNPENAEALAMGIELAKKEGAEIVIGTDPDNDRMGVAVRNDAGEMQILTGNQIGSLMAWYRTKTFFDQGIITDSNRSRAVLIKTFVTTELQRAIAEKFGVGIVDTLTGFKYISAKLEKYEQAIPADKKGDYRKLSQEQSRALRLEYSRFFIFGGEESYGYLGTDTIRDKDGNGAAVMFAELAAYAKSVGQSLAALLDDLYKEFGYHLEVGKALVMEGADGAAQIKSLAASYSSNPPSEIDGAAVTRVRDFSKDDFEDAEGDAIPKEGMLIIELADGRSCAVRPSGTEPKIKYYLFGKDAPAEDLAASKKKVAAGLDSLWSALEADAKSRMA
ncbi:phospho-sugar mutase [Verrucomicrobiaceae bacterium 5K15]|uniref:Phospho-sugar mutase n=1 Tax=Oceaniferula flava TaxID=2800421 RepID=A0AAE2SEF5_9BACT|nr:phospho-sugar mutase [Oceaniferula flavus]MBK1856249.1 phospho-sugar mutase [Oceaniferula flavus]MBM1137556.1 phospho-sugar mutase [Oceaniferula flavus]